MKLLNYQRTKDVSESTKMVSRKYVAIFGSIVGRIGRFYVRLDYKTLLQVDQFYKILQGKEFPGARDESELQY